ncbi:MAG TPA: hypothetical protein VGQ53_01530 [Chitinophagaceae bacterium]|jgi:hypothetical protein|nr:hypothetical protein [Chitinophagaceae bacterium]
MEVHHHSHTQPKRFRHYLWEFLMLFLAVFAGFLAENQREHFVEHQREQQYMRSLIKDLDQDTINIQKTITDEDRGIRIADSLIRIFRSNDYKNKTGVIYYFARDFATLPRFFYITDGTLMQLRNSAGLRLIRKQQVVDSLQGYYNHYLWLKTNQELESDQINQYRSSMMQIFDVYVFDSMVKGYPAISMPEGEPPLLSKNPLLINEFLMRAHFCKRNKLATKIALISLEERTRRLITQIKKEYHVE